MEKKNLILTIVVTAIISAIITDAIGNIVTFGRNSGLSKAAFVKDLMERYSFYEVDEETIGDYAAMGIAASVNDPYTAYFSRDEFSAFHDELVSTYVGVGATIGADAENKRLVIVSPMEDSPAQKAGLKSGDIILSIDGKTYDNTSLTEAAMYLKSGEIGSCVTMVVEREEKGELEITITRDKVLKKSVKSKMVTGDIGYLRITSFESKDNKDEKSTFEEFSEHLAGLKSAGMKKLIIDLRDNPGGDLNVVGEIADALLPEGIITYTEDKHGERYTISSDSNELSMPMAVLVNGGSASASEVLTGALKDHKKATILGTKTYGKGIVQTVFPFNDGSGMSITTAKYFTPSGVCIHKIGIEPDIKIEQIGDKSISDMTLSEDVQLKKAIEVLK